MSCASSSAEEMRVPAEKLCDHGLCREHRAALPGSLLRREQPKQRLELSGGRPGRQHLVRHVGEHHETERAVRGDETADGRADRLVVLRADAERQVDDGDPRGCGQAVRPSCIEAARRRGRTDEERERRDDEHHPDEPRAERRPAHRADVVTVDRGAARQQAHRPLPSSRAPPAPSARSRSSRRSSARAATRRARGQCGRALRRRGRRGRRQRARARGAGRRSR